MAIIAITMVVLGALGLSAMTVPARAGTGDNYPEPWRSAAQDSYVDSWGYYNRECTSWVAWALHDRNGFEMPRAIGNAANWGPWASSHGYAVNMTPAAGSVAWWNANHVAWVEAVNGDSVTIQEYNYGYSGRYNRRVINRTSASGYIHFKDIAPPRPPAPGALKNGGFETSGNWSASSIGFARYTRTTGGIAPHGGSYFAAVSNASGGGSLKQDVQGTVKPGYSYCATARVTSRTRDGAHGSMAMWFLGGTQESTGVGFSRLVKGTWKLIRTCQTAKYAHTAIRVEFYPSVNTADLGIDDVDLRADMVKNGGFNNGPDNWTNTGSANFITYAGGYEGSRYMATNAKKAGDSIRQDIAVTIPAGRRFCLDAMVQTAGGGTHGAVDMALWGLNGSEKANFNTGPMTTAGWRNISACRTFQHGQTTLRVQFYPQVGGKTIDIDAVFLRQM
ncbi:CHAP domain-containing protein [Actinomadura rubteroloni]|nr:CHAP domain-containing protein [Actinomadura rubteroloni]